MRPAGAPAYQLAKIISSAYDYLYPPLSPEQQKKAASDGLLAFMMQSPGFNADMMKAKDG